MKHQQAPKWLLTTALLAVLGANYGFQTNSLALNKEKGLFELSSETATGTSSGRGSSAKDDKATVAPAPTEPSKPLPKTDSTEDKTGKPTSITIEGKVLETGTCADGSCKSVVLQKSELQALADNMLVLARKVTSAPVVTATVAASTPALVKSDDSEYDCDFTEDGKPETRAQKRDRLKCEKEEKERSKREDRIAKFEDKMEDVKDRCEVTRSESKLECLTREFNSALNRYSGRNAIPANVVQRYFKNVVGSELSKMLFNSDVDQATAISTLQDVFDGLPAEYGQIRQNILSAIQAETKNRSAAINQQYKLADSYAKQNKPQEYMQAMGEAQTAQTELTQMADVYSAAARTSDSFSGDVSFAKYYQQTYLPAMRQIFSLMGPAAAGTTPGEKVEEGSSTRQNTRGGSTSSTPQVPTTRGQTAAAKVSNDQPAQWEFLNSSAGSVKVGTPSNTSRGNTRTARPMGN